MININNNLLFRARYLLVNNRSRLGIVNLANLGTGPQEQPRVDPFSHDDKRKPRKGFL
jgi:hypothetical protein